MSKSIPKILLLIGMSLLVCGAYAQSNYKNKQAKISVSGTSTMHDWESEVTSVECTGQVKIDDNKLVELKNVSVNIPVTSIKSTKGKIMDNKTYEAFKHEKYPNISFKLSSAKISGNGPDYSIDASGTLTMAGTSVPIELNSKAKLSPSGDLQITGSKTLDMTKFKMEPPTAMMGTIKVGEEVTVKFDITLTK